MKNTSILFTGDLGLTRDCRESPEVFSSDLLDYFETADAVCVSLELPFVDSNCRIAPYTHPSLISSPEESSFLEMLKPTVVNTGTNHCMDGGKAGIELTNRIIREIGASPVGAGADEIEAREAVFLTLDNKTFGFQSFCKKGNFTSSGKKPGAALLSRENLETDIPVARDQCDFLVVSLHMGMEFSRSVHPMYRELAHLAVDLGASCVIGHHPHVIQGIETYRDVPVFYSLGNFLFDNYAGAVTYKPHWKPRHQGILAKVFFSSEGITYEVAPVAYTSKPLSVHLAEGGEKQEILAELASLSEQIPAGVDQGSAESEAISAIAKREIATIAVLTKIHGVRFLWYFVKDLKIRHFAMLFRSLARKISRK